MIPELKELVEGWERFDDLKRGELTGYIVGKYGIEIILPLGAAKGFKKIQKLKQANRLMALEKLVSTEAQANALIQSSAGWKLARETARKTITIEMDKQGKHILGHRNYNVKEGKSIWTHPNPQLLLEKYSGKGKKLTGELGKPGFKEKVDFGEVIGFFVDKETQTKIPTTVGTIHYSKNGAHIVPAKPR